MAYKADSESPDYEAMSPYWQMVGDILAGQEKIKAGRDSYLPKFPREQKLDYNFRLAAAKFTNVFRDIVDGLAAKPFSKELALSDTTAPRIQELFEDIDGRGNNLHVFAAETFFWGISNAIDWILVDYTRTDGARTVEQERAAGARPYWVRVPATSVIWVESDFVGGQEVLTLVKIKESDKRVRIFERDESGAFWRVEEKQQDGQWLEIDGGPITIGVIPMVPFVTGQRKGSSWQFHPPMLDAANLQITLYQNESSLEYIKVMAAFPMLAGNGVSKPTDEGGNEVQVPVGPRSVLYAPPDASGSHGEWKWIEPSSESMRFLADDIDRIKKDLRELGRQPLTAQSQNLTVVTTAFAAQKGNSAVQAWALRLKDALEQALVLTAMWLGDTSTTAEVKIHTDFDVDTNDGDVVGNLIKLRLEDPENPQISQETLWEELKRRGTLSAEFSAANELQRLLGEFPGED